MIILHTSDWHIGHTLYGRQRHEEYEALLRWLLQVLQEEQVDLLLIAGDIFDSPLPGTRALSYYYRLLAASVRYCRHVVVIGGNHDSPALLDGPAALLQELRVHVIGGKRADVADEVLLLRRPDGTPELLLAAVPFLRERDLRTPSPGESAEEKEQQLLQGLQNHYQAVVAQAKQIREQWQQPLPLLVTGHLFISGCPVSGDEGMRDLYVGNLGQIPVALLPEEIDYLALGHLHRAQKVQGSERIRYSGSPLPLGFADGKHPKSMTLLSLEPTACNCRLLPVPCWQTLQTIRGSWSEIESRLQQLRLAGSSAWLEIIHEGKEILGNLRERIEAITASSTLQVLRIKEQRLIEQALHQQYDEDDGYDLDPLQVFQHCLQQHGIETEQQILLQQAFAEILHSLDLPADEES
ncbi:MAG: exonuclease SbcCD subunit D C-terminal domain-containing protein [Magnetococcales bacterium]|nr:exonuclease SbcCD subunit D C-terminal domain-containing protein [Magnetococcales bacterium]